MLIAVIGGSGHIGSFLVPQLVRAGHQVINLSRGTGRPYTDDQAWSEVTQIAVDRAAQDRAGTFGSTVAALEAEVVVDLICFTPTVRDGAGRGLAQCDRASDPLRVDLALWGESQGADARR